MCTVSNFPISVAARPKAWVCCCLILRLWVRIPPGAWMSVCCECCVLSGGGLCDGLITHPKESYRLWSVVCDLETLLMRRPRPTGGCCDKRKKKIQNTGTVIKLLTELVCSPA